MDDAEKLIREKDEEIRNLKDIIKKYNEELESLEKVIDKFNAEPEVHALSNFERGIKIDDKKIIGEIKNIEIEEGLFIANISVICRKVNLNGLGGI